MARIIDKPNKIKAKLIVEVEADFYDNESSEETLRYCVEQDIVLNRTEKMRDSMLLMFQL